MSADADYRPDLHGHVEASWRTKPPPDKLIERALRLECLDCNINVFVEEHPRRDGEYVTKIAHDATCPTLAHIERESST